MSEVVSEAIMPHLDMSLETWQQVLDLWPGPDEEWQRDIVGAACTSVLHHTPTRGQEQEALDLVKSTHEGRLKLSSAVLNGLENEGEER